MGLSNSKRELPSQPLSTSQHIITSIIRLPPPFVCAQYLQNLICVIFQITTSKAYVDIVETWGWKSYTIIYETNDGLLRLQELLKANRRSKHPTTVRQLPDTNDYRYSFANEKYQVNENQTKHKCGLFFFRPLLKQIKNSGVAHIVLDCNTEKIYDVLKQSQQIGMMSDYHSYLITSLVGILPKKEFWKCF